MNQDHQDDMNPNSMAETSSANPNLEGDPSSFNPQEVQSIEPEVIVETSNFPSANWSESGGEVADEAQDGEIQTESAAIAQANSALAAQLEDVNGQYRRLAADFENFRKRSQKEKEELEERIKGAALQKLLPVVDSFERARSHIKPDSEGEMAIHKSYQGVYKQMVDCLKQAGVSVMRPEGELFDPNLHEAVMREPTDQYPEGTVIEELVRGYIMGDRVLRHAMVKVAAPPEDSTDSGPSASDSESSPED